MLEKPAITDESILYSLQEEYGFQVTSLAFLPIGADTGTAVYRVTSNDGSSYFLKLRKGFEEITVTVPLFLKAQGIQEIISPIETQSRRGWSDFGEYKMILYPFIEGQNGFEAELTDEEKRMLGAALQSIHSAPIPPELRKLIPPETFSDHFRESMKSFQSRAENQSFDEPMAAKLAAFIRSKRNEIDHILGRADALAVQLQSQPPGFVLCHTDIHGGNILLCRSGQLSSLTQPLYIVDWDAPLLAPKERDLMFIGGGIDDIWKTRESEAAFYQGYGKTEVNLTALAYYRYERIIEDLVAYSDQLLLTDEGGADRATGYGWFTSNFGPGCTIEIADATYRLLA